MSHYIPMARIEPIAAADFIIEKTRLMDKLRITPARMWDAIGLDIPPNGRGGQLKSSITWEKVKIELALELAAYAEAVDRSRARKMEAADLGVDAASGD